VNGCLCLGIFFLHKLFELYEEKTHWYRVKGTIHGPVSRGEGPLGVGVVW
jgi:hypothetical protein